MNLKKFNEIADSPRYLSALLAQDLSEWKAYLEFVKGYFENRGIIQPVVVEIGVWHNVQKSFYEQLLSAKHIGIDINPNCSPDILGDSHEIETVEKLKHLLDGREIDLLFIDGNHSYDSVKRDYELFSPITKHIVAFHDICARVNSDVLRFWQEISKANGYLTIAFSQCNTEVSVVENKFINMGIGLIIKGSI